MSKIAAIQMCSTEDSDINLHMASQLITEAAKNDAELIVLPEMFACMSSLAADKIALAEVYGDGKIQDFLAEQARSNRVWLIAGTILLKSKTDSNRFRAACLMLNPEGHVVGRYDKVHLFDVTLSATESYQESATTEAGNQETVVVNTPLGKVGLIVCYDIRFPEQLIKLQQAGAEIIAIPAAFTVKTGEAHWKLLARARAVDTFCYVLGACQGGEHPDGRFTYGHSLIIDPWGTIQSEATETGNSIIYAEIDLHYLKSIRQKIPLSRQRENASL